MIWNYVETGGLVSLHVVFWNLVAPVITSSKTTWGYRELQMSRKLEHGPRHYNFLDLKLKAHRGDQDLLRPASRISRYLSPPV